MTRIGKTKKGSIKNTGTALDAIELIREEKKLIDQRLAAHHKNPKAGAGWKDVYKRIIAKK